MHGLEELVSDSRGLCNNKMNDGFKIATITEPTLPVRDHLRRADQAMPMVGREPHGSAHIAHLEYT